MERIVKYTDKGGAEMTCSGFEPFTKKRAETEAAKLKREGMSDVKVLRRIPVKCESCGSIINHREEE